MDFQKIKEIFKDHNKMIVLIAILSFIIRIIFLFYSPLRGWDETVYLNLGKLLSQNPFFFSLLNSGWNDFIPSTDIIYSWPNIGFRAPLLPYLISIFYYLKLDFFIELINPLLGALSVFLIYILGSKLFNKNIGLYSAILLSFVPIHVFYSGTTLTDTFVVFFMLLTFISFWKGYEEGNNKYKILFGLFLTLALLARYTTLWITPIFLFYFLIRDKSFKFIKDKYLWYAIGTFFITLIPWFLYGFKYYNNILGAFIHGFKAAKYWGGIQSWNFFFVNFWQISSIVGILFIVSLFYIFLKKEFIKKEIYFLLVWIIFFLGMAIYMPHKENRFIMPVIPAICLISGFFISNIKRYKNLIFGFLCLILLISLGYLFDNEYKKSKNNINICFVESNQFLASNSVDKNALVITNQSPIVFYYTQKDNQLYPDPWNIESLKNMISIKYRNRDVYISFSNYDMDLENNIKNDLDTNFKKVFECSKDWGYSAVYKFN